LGEFPDIIINRPDSVLPLVVRPPEILPMSMKASDGVDKSILDQMHPNSKVSYERYKKAYIAHTGDHTHSEESLLSFLEDCRENKKYAPTTLWTVCSLVKTYLRLELHVQIADLRTTTYLKKLMDIQKKKRKKRKKREKHTHLLVFLFL
jgi:hypothetical protein